MSRNIFGWSYPPGVTGNEYAIAGPDYEREIDRPCSIFPCQGFLLELGFHGDRWLACDSCEWTTDLERIDEPDPDRAYDEMRDRKMLGIDVPDGAE